MTSIGSSSSSDSARNWSFNNSAGVMVGSSIKRYVGQKVNVVRWKPPATHYGDTDTFLAGSWDDVVSAREPCVLKEKSIFAD